MRHVVPSREVAHLWYHQSQSDARNSNGSMYFRDSTIYSYGEHFPMGRVVTNDAGEKAALLTTRSYSVTTAKHKSYVWRAVPSSARRFEVPDVTVRTAEDHQSNVKDYIVRITDKLESAARARKYGEYALKNAIQLDREMRQYCEFFGLTVPDFKLPSETDLKTLKAELAQRAAKAAAATKERERVKRAAYQKEWEEKAPLWRDRTNYSMPWHLASLHGALLRLSADGENVETSQGATVPVSHAKRLLKAVREVKAAGKDWLPNSHTLHVGHYAVSRIEADGTLHAGCHVIGWPEIELIAPQLEGKGEQDGEPGESGSPVLHPTGN